MERLGVIANPETGERVGYVWRVKGGAYVAGSHLGYFETEEAAANSVAAAAQGRAIATDMARRFQDERA